VHLRQSRDAPEVREAGKEFPGSGGVAGYQESTADRVLWEDQLDVEGGFDVVGASMTVEKTQEAAQKEQPQVPHLRVASGGADGTRTRDLRRDRPAF
jgi:hypothetical protein